MAKKSRARLYADFLAEASRNPEFQKVLQKNLDKFSNISEEFVKKGYPVLTRKDPKRIHDITLTILALYQGMMALLASGMSGADVRKMWANSIDILFEGAE